MEKNNTAGHPSISVVIPCYNSEKTLQELMGQLIPVLEAEAVAFEITLVDDGSQDNTWKVIKELSIKFQPVHGIQLMKNSGQTNATLCGIEHTRSDLVATMDDDLQHRPDQLPLLLEMLRNHPDVDCVYGVFKEKKHSPYRNMGSFLIKKINQHSYKLPVGTQTSGFRLMTRQLAREIVKKKSINASLSVLILGHSRNVISVPVKHERRMIGRSNYTLTKQFRLAFDNICNSTMAPLRFVSGMGIGISMISTILIIYYLIRFFFGTIGIEGWTTLVLLISFFSGMILLSLGIIGEYLVRVLREISPLSPYTIRTRTEKE